MCVCVCMFLPGDLSPVMCERGELYWALIFSDVYVICENYLTKFFLFFCSR